MLRASQLSTDFFEKDRLQVLMRRRNKGNLKQREFNQLLKTCQLLFQEIKRGERRSQIGCGSKSNVEISHPLNAQFKPSTAQVLKCMAQVHFLSSDSN